METQLRTRDSSGHFCSFHTSVRSWCCSVLVRKPISPLWHNADRMPDVFFSGQSPGHPMDELHSDSHETVSLLALEKHVIGQHHKLQRLIQAKNQTTERDKTQHEQNYNSELLPHEFCLKIWMANVLLCFTYALPSLVKKTKTASAEFVIRRSSGRPDNKSRAAVGQWPEGIEKDKLEDAARR